MKLQNYYLAGVVALCAIGTTGIANTVVTNATPNGWAFDTRDADGNVLSNGPGANTNYVSGPATPPLGTGSAHLVAGPSIANLDGGGAAELRNTNYNAVLLGSLTSLNYSTYMGNNAPGGQQFPYLRLWVSWDGINYDDSLFFEPPYQTPSTGNALLPDQGPTVMNTWQTWDAFHGGWWANSGYGGSGGTNVQSLAGYIALHPTASIINLSGPLGGVGFADGFADPGTSYDGNIDNFTIGVLGVNTTYDFEPAAAVPLPKAGYAGLGLIAGLGLLGAAKRRRRVMTIGNL